ncbi:MAG: acyl-CoA thioesterase [Gemmatimonadota bacterium]
MSLEVPDLPLLIGSGDLEAARAVSDSRVTMTQLMAPQDANLFGSVFGGVILAAVDKIAYVCATRHACRPCVTVSVDQVVFRSPIEIGEIVTLDASVNTVGRTSVEVGVRVSAESVHGGLRRHTNSCYVTMVAIDEARRPVPVPRLRIETEEQYRRYHEAEERRAASLELARRRRAYRSD